jgi:uncharacterized protein YggE
MSSNSRAICLFAASLLVLVTSLTRVASAQEPATPPVPTIVSGGEAVVRRAPDRAFITAAVETRARDPRDAQRQNATAMTSVQQRLSAAGLSGDAVRTLGYTIRQEVDFVNGRRVLREYLARNAVEIRLDAVERTGEILDLVVQAGASSVTDVRFDLRDRVAAEREALRLAVVDARARADAAAAGAGVTVDRVVRIDDLRQSVQPPRPMMAFAREAADVQAATPIEAGDIEVRAAVALTVAIK